MKKLRKTTTSYVELQDIVFNLIPEILQSTSDLSSGSKRLKSKLYWMNLIKLLLLVIRTMQNENCEHLILDVGCGIGHTSKILSRFGFEVVGTDINSNDVWKKIHTKNLQFLKSDILHLPFQERTFNCIGAFCVLEHVNDRYDSHGFLDELNRVLKVGGILIISQLPSVFGLT